jgi:hypothetical protein
MAEYEVSQTVFETVVLYHDGRPPHLVHEWEIGEPKPTLKEIHSKAHLHALSCRLPIKEA